jgi:hypothetical protein
MSKKPKSKTNLKRVIFCWNIFLLLFVIWSYKSENEVSKQFGMFEISFESKNDSEFQFPKINFTKPNGNVVAVDGFYDGDIYKVRAYCNKTGLWKWEIQGNESFKRKKGEFEVTESNLKGKLKKHLTDPFQFAYDNNDWFLHIGDTGYRYLTDTEPKWQEYIDHAAKLGFTKIRTWFCRSRNNVEALFDEQRTKPALSYWQEMDKRIAYALENHPDIILQLIPFGEDTEELKRYYSGDSLSINMLRYAQARFSAYPNITWCISNDREIVREDIPLTGRKILDKNINKIGNDMARREPWETLITNHQSRFKGFSFVEAPWSDIITFEDVDQIDGRTIEQFRLIGSDPIVNDEDRYEKYREPEYPRYFFRRLMWASLLSGGHATYGGIRTYEAYDNDSTKGVQGYFNVGLVGAHDFKYIHKFFGEAGLTLANMQPDDKLVGNLPQQFKCIHKDSVFIVYLANPDVIGRPEIPGDKSKEISSSNENSDIPTVSIELPGIQFSVKWYDPGTGKWYGSKNINGGFSALTAPGLGDWVLLLFPQNS